MESSDDDYSDDEEMLMDGVLFTDSEDESTDAAIKANDNKAPCKNKIETIV